MISACNECMYYFMLMAISASGNEENKFRLILSEEFNMIKNWLVDNELFLHVVKADFCKAKQTV